MMTPGKDYSPCPHCSANNITHRSACWRCGYSLPYTMSNDGQVQPGFDPAARVVSPAELEYLLNQAVTIDVDGARRKQSEEDRAEMQEAAKGRLNAFGWLRKRLEKPSGA